MTTQSPEPSNDGVPPEAFDRVKRERDEAKAKYDDAMKVVGAAKFVDQIYEHLNTREYGESERKPTDTYRTAKIIARSVPTGTEDIAAAVDDWLTTVPALFEQPQAPATPETPEAPPAPMGTGPNPAAAAIDTDTGPFPVASDEADKFVKQHGMAAFQSAIADGLFYFSTENLEAQSTAEGL